jgi:Outer membrane protein beta-barrel domain
MALGLRLSMLLLLAFPAALSGQDRAPRRGPRPSVGGEVGYSRSDLGGPDAQRVRSRQGALTGVYMQLPLAGPLSVRPEILFALKGGRAQADVEGGGTVELDIGLAYIEVPVLLRMGPRRGRFRPVLFGGPAPALQIGCDVQIVAPNTPIQATCQETDLPAFRQFDVGLVAGGGLEMRWPQSALALEARYTTGLRSVLDNVDVRNRSFGIVLSLTF